MRAKLVNESNDPRLETGRPKYIGYEEDEFGKIDYIFNNFNGPYEMTGKISVDIWDIADFYGVSEDEMENNPHAITPEQIEGYKSKLNLSNIIWDEEEGPNPDEMRDFRDDR